MMRINYRSSSPYYVGNLILVTGMRGLRVNGWIIRMSHPLVDNFGVMESVPTSVCYVGLGPTGTVSGYPPLLLCTAHGPQHALTNPAPAGKIDTGKLHTLTAGHVPASLNHNPATSYSHAR